MFLLWVQLYIFSLVHGRVLSILAKSFDYLILAQHMNRPSLNMQTLGGFFFEN